MHAIRSFRLSSGLALVVPVLLASGATLAAAAPIVREPRACSDPLPQKVVVPTEDNLTLAATYYPPVSSLDKASAVVLVHDASQSREGLLPLAQRFQKSGFAVLALDLRGHGESARPDCTWKQLDAEAQKKTWEAMALDVKAGVDFIAGQKGVAGARVSLVASGSSVGLITGRAVRDERVRELVLLDPKAEAFGTSIVKDLQQLAGIPTLVVLGKSDQSTGKRLLEAVTRTQSGPTTIEIKNAKLESGQLLDDKSMYGDVARWMTDKYQPKAAGKN